MPEPLYAIVIEPSTDLQREQVQELVKRTADNWWHGMPDLWLVFGKSAEEWRDLISPLFPTSPSGKVLVLKIDNNATTPSWAYRALFPDSSKQWLTENF